ncbi:MAG TPA: XdhC family protein [Jiangellaceae bacterium]|nr:XdhC family protein [Jiangellaceae bacterium]
MDAIAEDPACAVAQGEVEADGESRHLVVVFASPVADHLLHFGRHLGYSTVLVDPAPGPVVDAGTTVVTSVDAADIDASADVVVTDHHREELGVVLRDVLAQPARWIGVMGSPRHAARHVEALRDLGVAPDAIARVHRPIGLNIGSRTPAEIAVATLAGLVADRTGRPGGFDFDAVPAGRLR